MSLQKEILIWTRDNGSFASGVDLLRRIGGNPHFAELNSYLKRQYLPPGAKEKLRQTLEKYIEHTAEETATISPGLRVSVTQATTGAEPESVAALRERGKSWKKRESFVHAQLVLQSHQPETPERKSQLFRLAYELMDEITPELDRIYDSIREYEQTGKVPLGNEAQIIKETVLKVRKRDSISTQVYRLRSRIARGGMTKEEEEKAKAQLAEKEAEWTALDKELQIADEESTR